MNPLIPDKTVLTIVFVAMRHIRNEEILLKYVYTCKLEE